MTNNNYSTNHRDGNHKDKYYKFSPRHIILRLQKTKNNVKISKESSGNEDTLTVEK